MVGDDEVGAVWGHYRGYVDLGYVDEDADAKKKNLYIWSKTDSSVVKSGEADISARSHTGCETSYIAIWINV